jgi:hypothetical protein
MEPLNLPHSFSLDYHSTCTVLGQTTTLSVRGATAFCFLVKDQARTIVGVLASMARLLSK